jgi:hypothetical protein
MVTIPELWLPILLATVLAFVAGFVLYMLLPLHHQDWSMLPDEGGIMSRLRDAKLGPGMYMFPCPADVRQANTPEFHAKLEVGPVGIMIVKPSGRYNMMPMLVRMLVYHLLISLLVAYLTGRALGPGEPYAAVFRVAGTAATLAYVGAVFPMAIWYGKSARFTRNEVIDGLVWGLLTGAAFAGLWPG